MKKTVKIEGLDCANCAKVLECELNKLDDVEQAQINFVKSEISFESGDVDKALNNIIKCTKKVEPNAKILTSSQNKSKNKLSFIMGLGLFAFGLILGVFALVFEKNLPLWAFWMMFVLSVLMMGYKTYFKALLLLCKGVVNENLLVTISVVGATLVHEHMEGLMVVALYTFGKILEGLAVNKSRKSIAELTDLTPEYANLVTEDGVKVVSPNEVALGSILLVKVGEKIPIDGKVIDGACSLNVQSLTGESVPVSVGVADNVLSGAIVLDGVLKIETTATYENSTASRIMDLIEHASEKKSKTETFISKMTKWYTLGVIALALAVWGIVWAVTKNLDNAIYRGLIFLVVSCPCAFAISVPLAYFSGIGNASRKGILIKGSNYLDACAKMNIVAFDKTGTLTTGQFAVDKINVYDKNMKENDVLILAGIGEQYSLHPLAKSIVTACGKKLPKAKNVIEKAGEGVFFDYKDRHYFVGRKNKNSSSTLVELFEEKKKLGEIILSDTIKPTATIACNQLSDMSIKTVMLSGDGEEVAKSVAEKIGVSEWHGRLLPEDKFSWIEEAKKDKKIFVGYVGDGINDAPSLMLADVGISMGISGSGASVEASDIVLVDDNPSKVPLAIKLSKFTRKIVWQNIILSAGIKLIFLILGAVGVTGMLEAVIADVGVTVLAICNSMRALKHTPKEK